MFKSLLTIALATAVSTTATAQTKAASLEERVAELEANSSLNVFSFKGTMLTRWDDLSAKQTVGATTPYDYEHLNYWRMKFSLDADANVSRYIKVYSRFSTSKFSNSIFRQDAGTVAYTPSDTQVADAYAGAGVYLEKGYADLLIPDSNFIFSVGRLPTVDGTPYDYYDNRARLGTYPMLSYNSPLDGMSVTYRADDYMPENQKLAVRFIYTPFTQVRVSDDNSGAYTTPPTAGGSASATGDQVNSNLDGYAGQVDYTMLNSGIAENANFILQYLSLNPLQVANNLKIGIDVATAAVDFKGVAGSRFDLAASYLATQTRSIGTISGLGVGFGTAAADEKIKGNSTLVTLRYRFTGWHVGGEYLKGSKDVFVYQGAAKDLTDFYATPGTGTHFFITKNFTEMLSLRLGYMMQDYEYKALSIGPTAESDRKVTTYYANMRLDF